MISLRVRPASMAKPAALARLVLAVGLLAAGCGSEGESERNYRTIRLADAETIASAAAERWEILSVLHPTAGDDSAFTRIDDKTTWHTIDVEVAFGKKGQGAEKNLPDAPVREEERLVIPAGTGIAGLIPVKPGSRLFLECLGSFGSPLHLRALAVPLPRVVPIPEQDRSAKIGAVLARFKKSWIELDTEKGGDGARGIIHTAEDTKAVLLLVYSPRKFKGNLEWARIANMGASWSESPEYQAMDPAKFPSLVAMQALGKVLYPTLRVPVRSRIEFNPITLPPEPVFRCSLGLPPGMSSAVVVTVVAETDDGAPHEVFSWQPVPDRSGWMEIRRDLPDLAGRTVRLKLTCDWARGDAAGASDASLIYCGAPMISSKNTAPEAPPYNVVLVSLDTLRYDHLGCYGYDKPVSPHLDSMAEDGVRFDHAYAQASFTLPSHASLLTSLYPSIHGAEDLTTGRLSEKVTMLAEVLAEHGVQTGGFTGGGLISHEFGFHQGFDVYCELDPLEDRFKDRKVPERHRLPDGSGGSLNLALDWLEDRQDQPFFLFLHTYMVHDFSPPEELARAALNPEHADIDLGMKTLEYLRSHFLKKPVPPKELAYCIDMYDATITAADQMIGSLNERLKKLGLDRRTLVLVTSDHGEEFQDHDGLLHGCTLYEEMIRVPLIASTPWPDAPALIEPAVSQIDIMPTIFDLLGIAHEGIMQGRSFLPLLRGGRIEDRPVYAEVTLPGFKNVRCIIKSRWKFVETVSEEAGPDQADPYFELYHLLEDPREKADASQTSPDTHAELRQLMNRMRGSLKKLDEMLGYDKDSGGGKLSEELTDFLKELGYM